MRAFGFLSFGHYGPRSRTRNAKEMLDQAIEIGVGADEIGVNGAYFRVHHFERQHSAPIPLLTAIAARTKRIEVGTGVIDLRYENPLYLAEEAAALDLIADGRVALGVSRGSPESANRGYEAFGYTGSSDPRGADLARPKFDQFMRAISGEPMVDADPERFGAGVRLTIQPLSEGLPRRIWWGAGTRESAEWAAAQGVNLMSSTLLTETTGRPFHELQREQIDRYRAAWRAAGHKWNPRVSVSRSVFPIVSATDAQLFGASFGSEDQVGVIDGFRSTFGKTYVGEPDQLIDQLQADSAVMAADTLMITIPNQLGPEYNLHLLQAFAEHVAPALGWKPNQEGPVEAHSLVE